LNTFATVPSPPATATNGGRAIYASPDAMISRRSRPCFGFHWGYATQAGQPHELIRPSPLDAAAWEQALPLLRESYPDWTFEPDWERAH
jgi:hypothetical protein